MARQGVRRICAHPSAGRLQPLFHAWPPGRAAVTGLPQRVYDRVAAIRAAPTTARRAALAGGPGHGAAAEEMQVNVIHALAGLRSLVKDESVTVAIHLPFVGDAVGHLHHPGQHRTLVPGEIVDGGNVLLGDDEHVGRRHRPDVLEGDDIVVAEDFLRGNLPGEDLAEQAVLWHRHSLPAEEPVVAAGQWPNGGKRTQGLTAGGRIYRDVVVAETTNPVREASVPDHLEVAFDESCLVRPALRFSLDLQPAAPFPADRVIHRQAEPGRGRSRPW